LVATASYEVSDPTLDSQVIALHASGANVLYLAGLVKPAAQAMRKADSLGWKPLRFLTYTVSPVATTPTMAGLKPSTGLISHIAIKDPQDPTWANDLEMKSYIAGMNKDYPAPDIANGYIFTGWVEGGTLVKILKMCNGDLTRETIMKVITHLHDFHFPGLLPGLPGLSTSPTDYAEFNAMRNMQFDGQRWVLLPVEEKM
jgi:ABC-type branched-subunit amino acid transport system substrate-binding protein